MTVPFIDLQVQYFGIKDEIDAAIQSVLDTSQFVLGPRVKAFEELFAPYAGSAHAIGVNSGTSALHLALLAAGVGPGDEVITTPFTFIATAMAIDYCGASPVFVDIDPVSFTIDPARIERAITPRTKAILPVHLFGQAADMDPILEIAGRHGLPVIEDAAQAHGAEYKSRRVGGIGALGCFSFYPGKNLGAYGEGGAITTGDPEYARTVHMLRDWGTERKYQHILKGFNFRLEGIQGAVLAVKMAHIEGWTEDRRRHARRYDELLAGSAVRTPTTLPDRRHVFHIYAVRHSRRDELQAYLEQRGVATGIHYPIPVHLQPAFAELGHRPGDFPHSEAAAREVLSLPMFPELTLEQQDHVITALHDWSAAEARHDTSEETA